jgi:hypothetical protein
MKKKTREMHIFQVYANEKFEIWISFLNIYLTYKMSDAKYSYFFGYNFE